MNVTRARSRWQALLGVLVILAMVAAACSDGEGDTTTTAGQATSTTAGSSGTTAAPDPTVKNPGVFVHAADDEPTTLDPAQVEPGEGGETVILQVYERLLEIGMSGPDPVPGLATDVPYPT